jgi:hypothetical protein
VRLSDVFDMSSNYRYDIEIRDDFWRDIARSEVKLLFFNVQKGAIFFKIVFCAYDDRRLVTNNACETN